MTCIDNVPSGEGAHYATMHAEDRCWHTCASTANAPVEVHVSTRYPSASLKQAEIRVRVEESAMVRIHMRVGEEKGEEKGEGEEKGDAIGELRGIHMRVGEETSDLLPRVNQLVLALVPMVVIACRH